MCVKGYWIQFKWDYWVPLPFLIFQSPAMITPPYHTPYTTYHHILNRHRDTAHSRTNTTPHQRLTQPSLLVVSLSLSLWLYFSLLSLHIDFLPLFFWQSRTELQNCRNRIEAQTHPLQFSSNASLPLDFNCYLSQFHLNSLLFPKKKKNFRISPSYFISPLFTTLLTL